MSLGLAEDSDHPAAILAGEWKIRKVSEWDRKSFNEQLDKGIGRFIEPLRSDSVACPGVLYNFLINPLIPL